MLSAFPEINRVTLAFAKRKQILRITVPFLRRGIAPRSSVSENSDRCSYADIQLWDILSRQQKYTNNSIYIYIYIVKQKLKIFNFFFMKTEIAGDRGGKWGVFLICLDVSQYKGGAFRNPVPGYRASKQVQILRRQ